MFKRRACVHFDFIAATDYNPSSRLSRMLVGGMERGFIISHLEGSSTSVGRPGHCQSPVLAVENVDVRQRILFDVPPV